MKQKMERSEIKQSILSKRKQNLLNQLNEKEAIVTKWKGFMKQKMKGAQILQNACKKYSKYVQLHRVALQENGKKIG